MHVYAPKFMCLSQAWFAKVHSMFDWLATREPEQANLDKFVGSLD